MPIRPMARHRTSTHLLGGEARALGSSPPSRDLREQWTTIKLSGRAIDAITRRHGYLWMGTEKGLVRSTG